MLVSCTRADDGPTEAAAGTMQGTSAGEQQKAIALA